MYFYKIIYTSWDFYSEVLQIVPCRQGMQDRSFRSLQIVRFEHAEGVEDGDQEEGDQGVGWDSFFRLVRKKLGGSWGQQFQSYYVICDYYWSYRAFMKSRKQPKLAGAKCLLIVSTIVSIYEYISPFYAVLDCKYTQKPLILAASTRHLSIQQNISSSS